MTAPAVHGVVAPGFEAVADAFADNLAHRGEVGAAFAVSRDGELLVDLWGGRAHPDGRAWQRDTLVPVFSGTKAAVATCVLVLVDRGALALDDPVARHWPAFGAHGKEAVTVAELLSHRARLPAVRTAVTHADLLDGARMAELLAAQPQETDPRAALVYHPLTAGWLLGELVRRVDPARRTLGRFLAEEVAGPLALDLFLGLPDAAQPRVATLEIAGDWRDDDFGAGANGGVPDPLRVAVNGNPPWQMAGAAPDALPPNAPAWRAAESPANGAVASARAFARLCDCLAHGGALDGVRLLSPATLARGLVPLAVGVDPFGGRQQLAFGAGFALQTAQGRFGPVAEAFGHGGWGGSLHAAWPAQGVGVSYAMNELRQQDECTPDPRTARLLDALSAALA